MAPPRHPYKGRLRVAPAAFSERSDFLQFDFDRFSRIAARVYREGNPYTLEECLEVFRLYFQTYEEYMGHPHPPIRREQIDRIMKVMPAEGSYIPTVQEMMPVDYKYIIPLHFKTKYRKCDYGISHFFSGRIRELRRYESDAGYE